jgi:hypothetical protein
MPLECYATEVAGTELIFKTGWECFEAVDAFSRRPANIPLPKNIGTQMCPIERCSFLIIRKIESSKWRIGGSGQPGFDRVRRICRPKKQLVAKGTFIGR